MTIEQIEQQRASIPDDGLLPASTTRDELLAIQARRATLDGRILQAREASATLAALASADEADVDWLTKLHAWRKTLDAELLKMSPRIRNEKELDVFQDLTISIRWIDVGTQKDRALTTLRLGELVTESGYQPAGVDPDRHNIGQPWRGSIAEVEGRIADLAQRRRQAQSAVDEALLDDDLREKRDAENKARLDALNLQPQRKTRGDGTQYDKYPDGRRVEVSG